MAIDFLASTPRCALFAGMGMGKTVITATYLDTCYNVIGEDAPTLILGPKNVVVNSWPDELAKWDHLSGLEISVAAGDRADGKPMTHADRAAALRKDVPLHAINYDMVPWMMDHYGGKLPYRRIVSDESTRLKNFRTMQGGVRSGAMHLTAHRDVAEWINLTGTPTPNGLRDLWGQTWFLDKGLRLGRAFSGFEERYFAWKRIKDALTNKPGLKQIIMPFADEQIKALLKDLCLTLDPKDWFDIADPIVTELEVELPPAARKHYREMQKDMFTLVERYGVEAVNSGGKVMKCLQIASGAVYDDTETKHWVHVHDAKIEKLESVINEAAGAPVVVSYFFKPTLARLRSAFKHGVVMDGKPATVKAWNEGKIQLLFAHPGSMGHGLNLQDGGNILVFFDHWWDMELHDQIIERIGPMRQFQSGHDRAVFVYYLVARKTVDEMVIDRNRNKRSVQASFLDYMKRNR